MLSKFCTIPIKSKFHGLLPCSQYGCSDVQSDLKVEEVDCNSSLAPLKSSVYWSNF